MISGVRAADSLHPLQQYSSSYESPMQSPPARDEIVNFKGNSQVSIERTAHKNHMNYPETISSQPERMAGAAGSSMNAAELDSTAFHPGTLYKEGVEISLTMQGPGIAPGTVVDDLIANRGG